MSRPYRRHAAWPAALCLFVVALALSAAQAAVDSVPLRIQTSGGEQIFHVEIAATPEEQRRGLMFRRSLADDAGMLFPFPHPRQAHFWMRNTFIPLDLLFIAADGRIESIRADAVPHDETPLSSRGEVIAVLEIPGGEAARRGIRPDDRVLHPALPGWDGQ